MSDQPPRVYLSMLIETSQAPEDVQLAVLASLSDRYKILNTNVAVVGEDSEPEVTFVACPVRGIVGAFVDDEDRATDLAKREGAVLVSWSADADHRAR